jgi:methionine synthase II (cobalamin-independent)
MDWKCLPACIGSLPHLDPRLALDTVLRHLTRVPFWPQLPSIGFEENMYAQYATHLPGANIDGERKRITVDLSGYDPEAFYTAVLNEDLDYFEHPRTSFHGLYELMDNWELPEGALALKGQVTGPVSLGLQIVDSATGKSVVYDEAYSEIVRKNLNMMLRWQERFLRQKCPETIMFLDEPSLSLVGTPFAAISKESVVRWINEVFENVRSIKAVHCCGNTDWPMVLSTSIDILSFDAYNYGHTIGLYPREVQDFLDQKGTIAWGVVPNDPDALAGETVDSLVERLERAMGSLASRGLPMDQLVRQALITPQCGLASLQDESLADGALHMLDQVSEAMREQYRLG